MDRQKNKSNCDDDKEKKSFGGPAERKSQSVGLQKLKDCIFRYPSPSSRNFVLPLSLRVACKTNYELESTSQNSGGMDSEDHKSRFNRYSEGKCDPSLSSKSSHSFSDGQDYCSATPLSAPREKSSSQESHNTKEKCCCSKCKAMDKSIEQSRKKKAESYSYQKNSQNPLEPCCCKYKAQARLDSERSPSSTKNVEEKCCCKYKPREESATQGDESTKTPTSGRNDAGNSCCVCKSKAQLASRNISSRRKSGDGNCCYKSSSPKESPSQFYAQLYSKISSNRRKTDAETCESKLKPSQKKTFASSKFMKPSDGIPQRSKATRSLQWRNPCCVSSDEMVSRMGQQKKTEIKTHRPSRSQKEDKNNCCCTRSKAMHSDENQMFEKRDTTNAKECSSPNRDDRNSDRQAETCNLTSNPFKKQNPLWPEKEDKKNKSDPQLFEECATTAINKNSSFSGLGSLNTTEMKCPITKKCSAQSEEGLFTTNFPPKGAPLALRSEAACSDSLGSSTSSDCCVSKQKLKEGKSFEELTKQLQAYEEIPPSNTEARKLVQNNSCSSGNGLPAVSITECNSTISNTEPKPKITSTNTSKKPFCCRCGAEID